MSWFIVILAVAAASTVVYKYRGERGLTKEDRKRLSDALATIALADAHEAFKRFALDIGKGPETFIEDNEGEIHFALSREIRKPRWRKRRYWMYLKDEPEIWTSLVSNGPIARKIDALLDVPPTLEQHLAALRAAGFGEELIQEVAEIGKSLEKLDQIEKPEQKEEPPCESSSPPPAV